MSGWGQKASAAKGEAPKYDGDYYRNLFATRQQTKAPVRTALVGRENTAKTGLAVSIIRQNNPDGIITILDCDNSAASTIHHVFPDDENIRVLPVYDEADESLFNEDNTVRWHAVIDKVGWYINLLGEEMRENPDAHAGFVFDGGSSFQKWCEFGMTYLLQNRSKNPIDPSQGDRFNQAEWRIRNQYFRDIISRAIALPSQFGMFTFHLKDIKNYVEDGGGRKVLMNIGERPDWVDGTQRMMNQQIFLTRYMKKADAAAGVKSDKSLKDGEWAVRGIIEEMKGKNMELLGSEHTILSVSNGKVEWKGIPDLKW